MYCDVLVTRPFDHTFTYKIRNDQNIKIGSIVSVSFGRKKDQIGIICGFCGNIIKQNNSYAIKEIDYVYEGLFLNKNIIKFIDWITDYTLAPKGLVLKLFLVNKNIVSFQTNDQEESIFNPKSVRLNTKQQNALNVIEKSLFKKISPIVLEGVTGSGKTEVYFEAIEMILKEKKQALIMLPEISLTPQLELRFKERFGFEPDIWHSKITDRKSVV